jgi:integrase
MSGAATGRVAAVPRSATGTIETHRWKDGRTVSFGLRVPFHGTRYRIDLGTNHEGWNPERAQVELERVMGKIERGTWQPPSRQPAAPAAIDPDETLHLTASRWWQRRKDELAPKTQRDYRWRLDHLLRHMARNTTAEINVRRVDWLREQLRARGLAPRSVNMVLDLLAQVLDDAVEYELLEVNPARGKRRRIKLPKPSRSFLEPDMVADLLDVAGAWERSLPEHQRYGRRALLATLCLAGPRISELLETSRGQLDLHAGELRLGKKTPAGIGRHLELSAFLLGELRAHLAAVPAPLRDRGPRLPLFPTRTGGRLGDSNVRNRLIGSPDGPRRKGDAKGVIARVNERRAAEGKMLLPERVTPQTFRRTFASLCFFAGRDLRWVMGQLGHDDPTMTLGVYAQCMKRSRIDEALVWQLMRFPDEPERRPRRRAFSPTNSPTTAKRRPRAPRNLRPELPQTRS